MVGDRYDAHAHKEVTVPEVGTFRFRRPRPKPDRWAIERQAADLAGGNLNGLGPEVQGELRLQATVQVLQVAGPPGWDWLADDPEGTVLAAVWQELGPWLDSFRPAAGAAGRAADVVERLGAGADRVGEGGQ